MATIEVLLLKRLVNDLFKAVDARCAVMVAEDGSVVASVGDETKEKIGEMALLLKVTMEEMASSMSLGAVGEILVEGPDYRMLTLSWHSYIIVVLTGKDVATVILKREVRTVLEETTILEGSES